jgi:hypothetical protein
MNVYEDGTHAVRNALACLIALRDGSKAGTVELPGGGEQVGNYSSVCDAIEWLQRHPQITAPAMPAHDTPPVSNSSRVTFTPNGTFIGQISIEKIVCPPGQGMNERSRYAVMMWTGDCWTHIEPVVPLIDHGVAEDYRKLVQRNMKLNLEGFVPPNGPIPPKPTANVLWFDMPSPRSPTDRPEHDGAFRVIASSGKFWTVQQWFRDSWSTPANFKGAFHTYWLAIDAIVQWSKEPGYRVPILLPDAKDLHAVSLDGWTIGEPTADTISTQPPGDGWPADIHRPDVLPAQPASALKYIHLTEGKQPEHAHTFVILPAFDIAQRSRLKLWQVMEWLPTVKNWRLATSHTFSTYADAESDVQTWATRRIGEYQTYLVVPMIEQFVKWTRDGFAAGTTSAMLAYEVTNAKVEPVEHTDPVTIPEAAAIINALAEETAAGVKVISPVIGHRTPTTTGDGFYGVAEWTENGWQPIDGNDVDDLTWAEVETKLFPDVKSADSSTGVGTCEIRPTGDPALFIVHIWTGKIWKPISGMVARGTAEGIVRAREMDPENRTAATTVDRVTEYRKAFREVKGLLEQIWKRTTDDDENHKTVGEALQMITRTLRAAHL